MKCTIAVFALCGTVAAFAQNSNVVSAYNYMRSGDLARAVEFIDPAVENATTSTKEKTWRYRGDIYRLIALGEDAALKQKFPDAMAKAVASYEKAMELDTKGSYKRDNQTGLRGLQVEAFNGGNDAFQAQQYTQAVALYEQSEHIAKLFGQTDTNAVYNSALALENAGDKAGAIKKLQQCLAIGYKIPDVYRSLSNLQKQSGDTNGALATLSAARAAHPGSKEIMLDELALLMELGRSDEVEKSLDAAIAADPTNVNLLLVKGQILDQKGTPKEGEKLSDADINKYSQAAEEAYKKAMEVDPKNFDAPYNIGVLYNNRAAYAYDKCASIKDDNAYTKCKKAADQIFLNAIPFFEKAHELDPADKSSMQQLRKLYAVTGNTAKFEAMKKLLGE